MTWPRPSVWGACHHCSSHSLVSPLTYPPNCHGPHHATPPASANLIQSHFILGGGAGAGVWGGGTAARQGPALREGARARLCVDSASGASPWSCPSQCLSVQNPASELGHSSASTAVPRLSLPPLPASGHHCPLTHAHLPALLEPKIQPEAWSTHPPLLGADQTSRSCPRWPVVP